MALGIAVAGRNPYYCPGGVDEPGNEEGDEDRVRGGVFHAGVGEGLAATLEADFVVRVLE
jgi:hypothetical protein